MCARTGNWMSLRGCATCGKKKGRRPGGRRQYDAANSIRDRDSIERRLLMRCRSVGIGCAAAAPTHETCVSRETSRMPGCRSLPSADTRVRRDATRVRQFPPAARRCDRTAQAGARPLRAPPAPGPVQVCRATGPSIVLSPGPHQAPRHQAVKRAIFSPGFTPWAFDPDASRSYMGRGKEKVRA